jgi:gamma-D-glutamyl-L-lysine dipeptidyl-peptidase
MPGILAVALFAAALPNAVVLRPVVNMYSHPAEDADVVSQAIYGANVLLLEQKDGWAHIRTSDDYTGWSPMSALRAGEPYAVRGRVAETQSLFTHVYREASVTRHAPIVTVPFETRFEVIAEPADPARWIQVRLPDDRPGWVQLGDVSFDARPLTVPETIALSRRFLGLPYTWGGASSFGYDCSGFMQMLCRRRGLHLPRDAQPQAEWSGVTPVKREDVKPGDLLYFGSSEKHITHTGMYIGDGKFIDATTYETPMIRIDSLDDPHWTRLLVAVRRVK